MAKGNLVFNLWTTLFAVWLILNDSLDPQVLGAGAVVATLLCDSTILSGEKAK